MQDNIGRTGSNWGGKTPRTMREAFPQYPDSEYQEPSSAMKAADVVVLIATVAVFAACFAIAILFTSEGWI